VEQRRVLDDQHVRCCDRLAHPDRLVVRSEPNVGKAWACFPSANAATERSSAAVTTPWPPRP
jgi:hypothetical protein